MRRAAPAAAAGAGSPPATVAGLYAAPCDPLLLAIRDDGRPLHGLTGEVDWRIGGRLSSLVRAGAVPADRPLLVPPTPLLPVGRIVLWRVEAVTSAALAAAAAGLGDGPAGLCPEDFDLAPEAIRAAFGERPVVLYHPLPDPR